MGQLHSVFTVCNSFWRAPVLFTQQLAFRKSKHREQLQSDESAIDCSIATLQSLPLEILLHMFSFLELKPYIILHGVCKEWQHLLLLAELHPIRRRLLSLYHRIINTPHFQNSLTWSLDNLQPFDRQVYIDSLLAQYPVIPEEFRMWILEWPARLVIACTWPGIQFRDGGANNCRRRFGVNWLGYNNESPQLFAVLYKNQTPQVKFIPALLIWRESCTTDWLVFAEDEPNIFGRVYVTNVMEGEEASNIAHGRYPDSDDDSDDESDGYINVPHADWVSYLEYQWENIVPALLVPEKLYDGCPVEDWPIQHPVPIEFGGALPTMLPTFPWNLRDTISHLALFS